MRNSRNRPAGADGPPDLDLDRLQRLEAFGLALLGRPARLAHDPRGRVAGSVHPIVVPAVQMPVQPEVREQQQVVIGVAEARRSIAQAALASAERLAIGMN